MRKDIPAQNLIDISSVLRSQGDPVNADWIDSVRAQIIEEHELVPKLEQVILNLQEKNNALELLIKILDKLSRNDYLSAKEQVLELAKILQRLDEKQ